MGIAGEKMLYHLDRLAGDHRPITADIYLTNFCNNRCTYCVYNRWDLKASSKYMTADEFAKYADRLIDLGVRGIILTGGGEPTVNPDFDKITAWLENRGIPYGINTNFNELKLFRPAYLKVSLDGYDEESYERNRGVRRYTRVYDNIVRYAEWKEKNSPKTSLGIQYVATNPFDVRRFYIANKYLDVDYIVFRPLESTDGKQFASDEALENARNTINAIEDLSRKDTRVSLNFKWQYLSKRFDRCIANWSQIALNENGEVIYCCHKPYQIVGHIMDDDILEKKEKATTNMKMCDVPCRLTAPNCIAEAIERNSAANDAGFI